MSGEPDTAGTAPTEALLSGEDMAAPAGAISPEAGHVAGSQVAHSAATVPAHADARPSAGHDLEAGAGAFVGGASDDEIVEYRSGHQCCTKVGNTILICGEHPGYAHFPRKCLVGPDWPCLLCTYTLIIVPNIAAISYVFLDAHIVFLLLSFVAFGFTLIALSLTACTDPGIVPHRPPNAANTGSNRNICRKCNVPRRAGTLHCYDCNCCVEEMDHHCPWTGKCIGKQNLCYFYTFLTAIVVNIFYVVAGVFIHMSTQDWTPAGTK